MDGLVETGWDGELRASEEAKKARINMASSVRAVWIEW